MAFTNESLREAVQCWCTDRPTAFAQYGHISAWDTSAVTDMSRLFENQHSFNDDISAWNTSQVTNMEHMFHHAHAFNQPLETWNVRLLVVMVHAECIHVGMDVPGCHRFQSAVE